MPGTRRAAGFVTAGLLLIVVLDGPAAGRAQGGGTPPGDPVARLIGQIDKGEAALAYETNGRGYLRSLLAALDVHADSRMLDIYFNDSVFVRLAPGGELQLAAADPGGGVVFYSLGNGAPGTPRPERRDAECASCHGSGSSAALLASASGPGAPPTSDLAALMTFEHQVRVTNLIGGVGRTARTALAAGGLDAATSDRLDAAIEQLVASMLFGEEALLREPVTGASTFADAFPLRGPRDGEGRSLRDFDRQTRLFRYPLSYMVYSDVFDALPAPALERIYTRLFDVLSGNDQRPPFARLSIEDRQAIREILVDTKPGLPGYFR